MSHAYLTIIVLIVIGCSLANAEAKAASNLVIGGLPRWSRWGRCSKTCAGGVQIRRRTCINPRLFGGLIRCRGASLQRRSCPCKQVNGRWSGYGRWSPCSKNCGGGTRTRTRSCTRPRPSCCGAKCRGSSRQTRRCNTQICRHGVVMAHKFALALMANSVKSRGRICLPRPCHGTACLPQWRVCRPGCIYGDRDFLLIIDSSGSIGRNNHYKAKKELSRVASALCGNLGTDLQVAAMQFSNRPRKEFAFNKYTVAGGLTAGIMAMPYLRGGTRTWLAFEFARTVMFTAANGHRPSIAKQALIVTDGRSNYAPTGGPSARTLSIASAQALKDTGVELFALWIGNHVADEIRKYVSLPIEDHVFSVDSVQSLHDFVNELWLIHKKICNC